jgi:hypothetical protein
MSTGRTNNRSHQTALRLPHDLYIRIRGYADEQGLTLSQTLLRLIRVGLGAAPVSDALGAPWQAPLRQLTDRFDALELALANLGDAMVSNGVHPRVHDTVHPTTLSDHSDPTGDPDWSFPPFNEAKHYWGRKCANGHNRLSDHGDEEAMRFISTRACVPCAADSQRKYRAQKGPDPVASA